MLYTLMGGAVYNVRAGAWCSVIGALCSVIGSGAVLSVSPPRQQLAPHSLSN